MSWLKAHPTTADGLLALSFASVTVALQWAAPTDGVATDYRDPGVISTVLVLVSTLPVMWRRRAPMAVLLLTAFAAVIYEAAGFRSGLGPFGVLVALYTVAAHCDRVRTAMAAGIAAVAIGIVFATARWEVDLGSIISNALIFGSALLIGDNLKTRRAYVASLQERAERAEQNREEDARRAVAVERARIARELHDVVAHSMSVMIVQAGAARRVLQGDPERAGTALSEIEATGRQAMTEMRRLLGVLRDEQESVPALAPQPSMRNMAALVDQFRVAGLDVRLDVVGDEIDLPPGVDLSAYRIVQEALTNALKHAGPASAVVTVCYTDDRVEVEVCDDGRGAAAGAAAEGAGHGLVGMRERVDLFGGVLRAGPQAGGGFAVLARLPLEPVARSN